MSDGVWTEALGRGSMIYEYLELTAAVALTMDREQIARVIEELHELRDRAGRLFLIGNGGGAGHASHAAADFRKIARIESYAWGDNLSDLTAYTNDEGWPCATARWLEDSRCGPNDALFVFSVGGSSREVSQNLKEAMFWAKGGPRVLGIVGSEGGYVAEHGDAVIVLPTSETPHVEGLQAVLWHLIVTALA